MSTCCSCGPLCSGGCECCGNTAGTCFTLEEHILNAFSLLGLASGGRLPPWGGDMHLMLVISLTGIIWVKSTWQPSGCACQPSTGLMWCLVECGLLERWSRQEHTKFCFVDFILRFSFQRHKAWGLRCFEAWCPFVIFHLFLCYPESINQSSSVHL